MELLYSSHEKKMCLMNQGCQTERLQASEASIIAEPLKQPWDYLPQIFSWGKNKPLGILMSPVANVPFLSTCRHTEHSTSLPPKHGSVPWDEM